MRVLKIFLMSLSSGAHPRSADMRDTQTTEIDAAKLARVHAWRRHWNKGSRLSMSSCPLSIRVQVGDRAAHRAIDRKRCNKRGARNARHQSRRRAEAGDAAVGRRRAQAATIVGTRGDRHLSNCKPRTAEPPDEPPHVFVGIERIAGGAIDAVLGVGTSSELRCIGFGERRFAPSSRILATVSSSSSGTLSL